MMVRARNQRYADIMATVQVRNVDDTTYQTLRRRAVEAGQSLQEYLRELLSQAARQPTLTELFSQVEAHTGGRLSPAEAVAAIRADRDHRS